MAPCVKHGFVAAGRTRGIEVAVLFQRKGMRGTLMASVLVQNKNSRNQLVDCLKGYACLLVVFGHVIRGIRTAIGVPLFIEQVEIFIWSFHVALFMFLSGYVYSITGGWEKKGTRVSFLKNKFLNLAVPYFTFSIIYIVINCSIPGVNNQDTLSDIFWLWKTPVAQYWFLYSLFVLFVLWTLLSTFLKNWQITLVLVLLYYFCILSNFNIPFFCKGLSFAFCFGLGTSLTSLKIDTWTTWKKVVFIILHIILAVFFIFLGLTGKFIIDDFEELLGISASVALISIITKLHVVKRFLLLINKYSFPIYLLHTIFTAGIRLILSAFGIKVFIIHVACGMTLGVIIPIIVEKITEKFSLLNFFFYPSKNVRIIQNRLTNDQ